MLNRAQTHVRLMTAAGAGVRVAVVHRSRRLPLGRRYRLRGLLRPKVIPVVLHNLVGSDHITLSVS